MSMNVLFACRHVYNVHAWYLQRLEEGIESPRTGVIDDWELLSECWKLNLGPLQEQKVLLTTFLVSRYQLPFYFLCFWVFYPACICMCTMCIPGAMDPLKQIVVTHSCHVGVGIEPGSSRGATSTLNYWAIFLVPRCQLLIWHVEVLHWVSQPTPRHDSQYRNSPGTDTKDYAFQGRIASEGSCILQLEYTTFPLCLVVEMDI